MRDGGRVIRSRHDVPVKHANVQTEVFFDVVLCRGLGAGLVGKWQVFIFVRLLRDDGNGWAALRVRVARGSRMFSPRRRRPLLLLLLSRRPVLTISHENTTCRQEGSCRLIFVAYAWWCGGKLPPHHALAMTLPKNATGEKCPCTDTRPH